MSHTNERILDFGFWIIQFLGRAFWISEISDGWVAGQDGDSLCFLTSIPQSKIENRKSKIV